MLFRSDLVVAGRVLPLDEMLQNESIVALQLDERVGLQDLVREDGGTTFRRNAEAQIAAVRKNLKEATNKHVYTVLWFSCACRLITLLYVLCLL